MRRSQDGTALVATIAPVIRATTGVTNPYSVPRPAPAASRPAAPTAIDLFSGAGGLALGLSAAGFDLRACLDADAACGATHRRNLPGVTFMQEDMRALDAGDARRAAGLADGQELDLLAGGPPCQGFSILGQRNLSDPRNGLFREFMRVAAALRPRVILIENVPGLATLEGGAVLAEIARAFDAAGYTADCAELVAAQYGVPQMRWRMFFIGWRRDLGVRGGFPAPTHGAAGIGDLVPNRTVTAVQSAGFLTVRDAIGDLPGTEAGHRFDLYPGRPACPYQEAMRDGLGTELWNHYAPRLSAQNLARIRHLKPGQDWRDLPWELLPGGMRRALRKDHTRRYRRMTWDGVARSIITRFRDPKSGEYIHPDQHRTISIREAARIQSFPDWFVFEGGNTEQYDQVGNAVPPLLAKAVGSEILRVLAGGAAEGFTAPKSRYRLAQPALDLRVA